MDYVDADKKVAVNVVKRELFSSKMKKDGQKVSNSVSDDRNGEIVELIRRLEENDKEAAESAKFRTNITVKTKDGRTIIIRGTPRVFPIWYTSTGAVYSDWSMLSGGEKLQAHLKDIYEKGNYIEYLTIVKNLLDEEWMEIQDIKGKIASTASPKKGLDKSAKMDTSQPKTTSTSEPVHGRGGKKDSTFGEILAQNRFKGDSKAPMSLGDLVALWRQFILTANAMAGLAIQNKKTDLSQQILRMGTAFASRGDILPSDVRRELEAFMNESNAYFFFRKKSYGAATALVIKAIQEFESRTVEFGKHHAAAKLHLACIQSQMGEHKDAHKVKTVSNFCVGCINLIYILVLSLYVKLSEWLKKAPCLSKRLLRSSFVLHLWHITISQLLN
jgi:hypothetical protein